MLTNALKAIDSDIDATYGTVHNYYEKLVLDAIRTAPRAKPFSHDLQSDLACIALNKLPTKYVRYDVDTMFYLTGDEQSAILERVNKAVNEALDYMELRLKVKTRGLAEEA